jgi:hypothetical protein
MKQAPYVSSWPLALSAIGLTFSGWLLALQAVVTYPIALLAGALAALALVPPARFAFLRRWEVALGSFIAAVLLTVAWHAAWS